ncbi:MAG TPA: formylglycine-generating enzyme family protein [Gammaproteobacteria bacterium]|nr:formylglycine-generating enzyme family protein [Gammaproteobacteria bacterium]
MGKFRRSCVFVLLALLPAVAPLSGDAVGVAPAAGSKPQVLRDRLAGGGDGPEMISLPAGSFRMGSAEDEIGRAGDEGPRHRVEISKPFAISRYEVTVAQFRRFVESSGYRTDAELDGGCFYFAGGWETATGKDWRAPPGFDQEPDHPVVCVSFNDAIAYARWLAQQTGSDYRLPTEAEWEYAARAGSDTSRPWGDDPDEACAVANVADRTLKQGHPGDWPEHGCIDGFAYTAPVGSFGANAFGLHDVIGNVWEWTCSGYSDHYGGAEEQCAVAVQSIPRVFRGGSWYNFPAWARSAARSAFAPGFRAAVLGFRVARDL